MDSNELLDPFNRLLETVCPPAQIRAIEAGGDPAPLWSSLVESGFLDALTPEAAGGAGLSLGDIAPLLQALGRHAPPLPIAETMVARALLAQAGAEVPQGPIVLAVATAGQTGVVPLAQVAEHALVQHGDKLILTPIRAADLRPDGVHRSLAASIVCSASEGPAIQAPAAGLRALAAVLHAAAIAGAGDRLLEMTVAYANERVQFGRPIGKHQAVQQQLAVMAEQVVAARIAAQLGCCAGLSPSLAAAAAAKHAASVAAVEIARTAHAVHGAIGISEELDLQLFTRRLHAWRLASGAESYWAEILGGLWLADGGAPSLDFVRSQIDA